MKVKEQHRFPFSVMGYEQAVTWLKQIGKWGGASASTHGQSTDGWSVINTANALWDKQVEDDYDAALDQALALLRDLADLQNGPPLETHRKQWEETMEAVYAFLNKHEPSGEI